VLEAATEENGVTLVKIDVDANPEVSRRFGIASIPAVKAFRNGHVVAEFVGARSRPSVDTWLEELTQPSLAEQTDDPVLQQALEGGDYERAFELLLGRLGQDPDGTRGLMVKLFGELGHEHPLTVQYRRRLATALY
jgi:putative thioredoxin